ncbi:hypothetical protein ACQJBY_024715 [Aegilops geniculata]
MLGWSSWLTPSTDFPYEKSSQTAWTTRIRCPWRSSSGLLTRALTRLTRMLAPAAAIVLAAQAREGKRTTAGGFSDEVGGVDGEGESGGAWMDKKVTSLECAAGQKTVSIFYECPRAVNSQVCGGTDGKCSLS